MLPDWLDPQVFLADPALGPWVVLVVCAIVFAETGLLVGFFLPGDSLLFTAGLLVATGTVNVNIWALGLAISMAAFLGDQLGYWIGRKAGPAVFSRPESRIFRRENVLKAEEFFVRHGGKAVILARFVGVIRTFTPVVAGVGRMPYRTYVGYDAIGALLWGTGITLLGYVLGNRVPFIRDNLDLLVVGVVLVTVVPVGVALLRQKRKPGVGLPSTPEASSAPKQSAPDTAPKGPAEDTATNPAVADRSPADPSPADQPALDQSGPAAEIPVAEDPSPGEPTTREPATADPDPADPDPADPDPSPEDPTNPDPPAARRVPPRQVSASPAAVVRPPERHATPPGFGGR